MTTGRGSLRRWDSSQGWRIPSIRSWGVLDPRERDNTATGKRCLSASIISRLPSMPVAPVISKCFISLSFVFAPFFAGNWLLAIDSSSYGKETQS